MAQLWVGKLIIDQVVRAIQGRLADPHQIWVYLAFEIALAVLSDLLSRAVNLSDSLLGDKFTNHVSLRLMEHANRLDLVSFEDPVFYDKLERARRQTTARLGMLGIIAGMGQQLITLLTLLAAVVSFSPWFLLLLVGAVIPAFLGETRFAMLAYSTFGHPSGERSERVREAVAILDRRRVDFEYDGEMAADVALNRKVMEQQYPFCRLSGPANVLVMPAFHSASISTKMLQELGGSTVIGPLLVGLDKAVQITSMGAKDSDIVNMAAIAAYGAGT